MISNHRRLQRVLLISLTVLIILLLIGAVLKMRNPSFLPIFPSSSESSAKGLSEEKSSSLSNAVTSWVEGVEVQGDSNFQYWVRQSLAQTEATGWGRFVYLNVARIKPNTNPYYWDVGGWMELNTDGSRGTFHLNAQYATSVDFVAAAIIEEAFHQSQKNNGHPYCARLAEYTASWIRRAYHENAGTDPAVSAVPREWESIPDVCN